MDRKRIVLAMLSEAEESIKAAKMQVLNANGQVDIAFATICILEAQKHLGTADRLAIGRAKPVRLGEVRE